MKKVHLGDKGTTSVFDREVSKSDCHIEALGGLDELNSFIGLCRSVNKDAFVDGILVRVQNDLFSVSAEMSAQIAGQKPTVAVKQDMVNFLDQTIVDVDRQLPALTRFILPNGTQLASMLHAARAVCRRAETKIVEVNEKVKLDENIIPYVNRLSDVLFDLARYVNNKEGVEEVEWKPE